MLEIETLARQRIQILAADFNLHYDPDQFRFLRVNAREKVLLDFLYGCPTEPYSQYGDTPDARIARLADFLAAAHFMEKVTSLTLSGAVLDSELLDDVALPIGGLPPEAERILADLKKRIHEAATPVLRMTITMLWPEDADPEKLGYLLLHEWCHVLAFANNLKFQNVKPELWLRDEGLATLWEVRFRFPDDPRGALEQVLKSTRDRGAPREVTGYYQEALILLDILKDCRTPVERHRSLYQILTAAAEDDPESHCGLSVRQSTQINPQSDETLLTLPVAGPPIEISQ